MAECLIDTKQSSSERPKRLSRAISESMVSQQGFFPSQRLSEKDNATPRSDSNSPPSPADLVAPRSPICVPGRYSSFAHSFNQKLKQGELLGDISPYRESNQYCQFTQTRMMAKQQLKQLQAHSIKPTSKAIHETTEAMKDFFRLSYAYLVTHDALFPLADRNKCLGFAVVPGTCVVILAISQDKNPHKDDTLRQNMIQHLSNMNVLVKQWVDKGLLSKCWTFELAKIPTREQYLLPRTLSMRTPHKATTEWVAPRTRCVELALSTALCKAQRTRPFMLEDIYLLTVGGVIWRAQDEPLSVHHFETAKRNLEYRSRSPIEIPLSETEMAYIDVWDPCKEHCQIYMNEMLAIASAGGNSTSYTEPRAESDWAPTLRPIKI